MMVETGKQMEAVQEPVCFPVWMPKREYQCQKCSLEPPWPILQCLLSPSDTVLIIKPSCEWCSTLDLRDQLFIVMLLFDNCCKNECTNKSDKMKNKSNFCQFLHYRESLSFFRGPKILLLSTFWQSNQSKYHLKQAYISIFSLDCYYYTLCGCVCVSFRVAARTTGVRSALWVWYSRCSKGQRRCYHLNMIGARREDRDRGGGEECSPPPQPFRPL